MKRAVLLLSLGLGACGLSEQQCNQGDWFGIGLKDGRQGHLPERVEKHGEACSKFGILPNIPLWEEGRQRGLKTYCTVDNAYQVGRNGYSLKPSCPAVDQPVLRFAHQKGARYYELTEEIDALEREIEEIRADLIAAAKNPKRRSGYSRSDITFRELRIFRLMSERRRYSTL